MPEMTLPGVYIEVRPEALIVAGRVSVNNVGIVGTAGKGLVNDPTLLSSYAQAREIFGDYDAWDEDNPDVLTLVRALELAFGFGATTVNAVRIANNEANAASYMLTSEGGDDVVLLSAKTPGKWGNDITVNVTNADTTSFVENQVFTGGGAISLNGPVAESVRNRVKVSSRSTPFTIVYEGTPNPGQVMIDTTSGALTFHADDALGAGDEVTVAYAVPAANSAKVTLKLGTLEEVYTIANGNDLAWDVNKNSSIATANADATNGHELPNLFADKEDFQLFGGGVDGASDVDYEAGLSLLTNENVHIVVAAGQSHVDMGDALVRHVRYASNDDNKRERIGIIGSGLGESFDAIREHALDSDRIVFVVPGIIVTDSVLRERVTLPGAYTAAAIAGLMASYDPHISLTNKPVPVADLEFRYTNPQLKELIGDEVRAMALQYKLGFKVVRGITTSSNTAWKQITTRRIVDYARYGVRSAADSYIGLLNNERVRGALRATINSFLAEMVEDEKLISYDLNVSATREQERQGICVVTMVIRPVFSIDFIKVTMFLE